MALSGVGRMPGIAGGAPGAAGGVSARVTTSRQQYQTTGRTSFSSPRTSLDLFAFPRPAPLTEAATRVVVAPRATAVSAVSALDLSAAQELLTSPFFLFQDELETLPQQQPQQLPILPQLQSLQQPSLLPHAVAVHQQAAGSLPEQLSRLQDPTLPVALPPPGSVPSAALDNWKLDKLVSALGRNRATWRRCLHLYEWLKDSGHHLDDRLCTTLIRVCADHGDSLAALGVYEWMRSPCNVGGAALTPTTYTYTAAMRAALSVGLLDRAMSVWEDATGAGLVPDCRLCITYIETCTRLHLTDKALAMYGQMRDSPAGSAMAPSVHAFTAAMRAATEGGRWYRALDIWEDMKKAGCAASGHAYAAVISACACGSDWVRAVALFEEMSAAGISPDVVSCTALITALAAAGESERAEQVVRWMLTVGLKPNVRTYTALLTAMGNAKQWTRAVELLWAMQQPDWGAIQPNAYTYSALLKSLGEHGQWQLAEAVFSHLEAQLLGDLQRNGASAATTATPANVELALRLRCAVADATAAAAVRCTATALEAPQQAVVAAPPLQSYQRLRPNWTSPAQLNGLSFDLQVAGPSSSSTTTAAAILPAAAAPAPAPVSHSTATVLAAPSPLNSFSLFSSASDDVSDWPVASEGDYDTTPSAPPVHVPALKLATVSKGVNILTAADSPTWQTLAQISASLGDQLSQMSVSQALSSSLYGSTSSSNNNGQGSGTARSGGRCTVPASARPENRIVNEVVCGALMLAYERAGKWQEAVMVLTRALALGIPPNTVMYNTAISAAGKAGELGVAEQLFALVRAPDAVTHETLIAAYGMAGLPQKAEGILRSMLRCGLRPRDFAYCGLIAAHSLAGDWEGALRVRKRLRRDGVTATAHVYNALIAACERAGQYERALELFQTMRRDGVEPNAVTQQLMVVVGRQGAQNVEGQQVAAAALSAAFAAAGALVMQTGAF